jgi:prepilin-type N-terminal cleavage/methylation domain-containing protein
MKTAKGFTLIELLVVLAIIAILGVLVFSFIDIGSDHTFTAEVIEKWSDLDGDNLKQYRVRTRTESNEVETWNSSYVHDKVTVGKWYNFKAGRIYLKTAEFVPSVPIEESGVKK